MFRGKNIFKKIAITILLSMVFAVNLGVTWAFDYQMEVSSKTAETLADDSYSYLNDVVVNNSTTLSPISYRGGTVAREISFDYGFSSPMDVAIVYEMQYTDGSTVDNVIPIIDDRDNYVLDVPTVYLENNTTAYNQQASNGTLYYLGTIAGSGTKTIFTGFTFTENNNQVTEYKADESVTLYSSGYAVGAKISASNYEYCSLEIARYWKISKYSNGSTEITADEYNALSASEKNSYSISKYQCVQAYTITTSATTDSNAVLSATLGGEISSTQYKNAINTPDNFWKDVYQCIVATGSYTVGTYIESSVYSGLTDAEKECFSHEKECTGAYTLIGSSHKTVATGGTITAEEYANLYALEQARFTPSAYSSYKNKKLKLDVKVYTKLNVSATDDEASEYYNEDHYFINFKQQLVSRAYENWLLYKQNTDSSGTGKVTSNKLMIYNAHGKFETGLRYVYDFSKDTDITSVTNTANITSQYVYYASGDNSGKFYAYAGGNRYNAGIGLYYMTAEAGSLRFSIGYNWYLPNGTKMSSTAITNVNIATNSLFTNYSGTNYGLTKTIPANSYGYIDLLEYIEITTKADIYNLIGCKLVINSIDAEFTSSYSTGWSPSGTLSNTGVSVNNSTQSSPVLFKYSEMQTGATINSNLSLTNNSDEAKSVSLTVTPKFYAYNGQTGDNYAIAKTKTLTFGDSTSSGTRFNYKNGDWSKSGSSSYTFSSSGIYLAPHTTVNLIENVYIAGQTQLSDWQITLDDTAFYADYWFVLEVSNLVVTTASTNKTSSSSAELISELVDGTISSGTSYISMRNNTSQIITQVVFSANLKNIVSTSYSVSYTYLNYATNASTSATQASTISITFSNVNLLPGESIILAKITLLSGANVGITSYTLTSTLGGTPTYSSVYAKRDFASGNLSVVNGGTNIEALSVSLKNFAGTVTLTDTSKLTNSDKWSYAESVFNYTEKTNSNASYLHGGQIINILQEYYDYDITITIN